MKDFYKVESSIAESYNPLADKKLGIAGVGKKKKTKKGNTLLECKVDEKKEAQIKKKKEEDDGK